MLKGLVTYVNKMIGALEKAAGTPREGLPEISPADAYKASHLSGKNEVFDPIIEATFIMWEELRAIFWETLEAAKADALTEADFLAVVERCKVISPKLRALLFKAKGAIAAAASQGSGPGRRAEGKAARVYEAYHDPVNKDELDRDRLERIAKEEDIDLPTAKKYLREEGRRRQSGNN